ncbi:MAG TPA: type II toxin-antitoxin system prevent-host-death family antitoxin [Terriglobales bacterium]|nr:type II toxin-antitoxin system prevent-host-death family antitoxin [Terriglobales bacterium]
MAAAKTVGVREAKNRLSALLKAVRRGQEWVITDRGEPVARLVPLAAKELTLDERIQRLEAAGILTRRNPNARPLPPPIRIEPPGIAQRWLQEDRDR